MFMLLLQVILLTNSFFAIPLRCETNSGRLQLNKSNPELNRTPSICQGSGLLAPTL